MLDSSFQFHNGADFNATLDRGTNGKAFDSNDSRWQGTGGTASEVIDSTTHVALAPWSALAYQRIP